MGGWSNVVTLLQSATPDSPIDVVLGNRFAPTSILSYEKYRKRLREHGHDATTASTTRCYWSHLELARLITENLVPHVNYFALGRLLRKNVVKNIVTVNYDLKLQSFLRRMGHSWQLNPLANVSDRVNADDGYFSAYVEDKLSVFTIHGYLEYIRSMPGNHLVRQPKYLVQPLTPGPLEDSLLDEELVSARHYSTSQRTLSADTSNSRDHSCGTDYRHHIDSGVNIATFDTEFSAAVQALTDGPKTATLVMGLTFSPYYRENIMEPLLSIAVAHERPIVYVIPTEIPLKDSDAQSEFYRQLVSEGLDENVINEVGGTELHEGFLALLDQLGERGIEDEQAGAAKDGVWSLGRKVIEN